MPNADDLRGSAVPGVPGGCSEERALLAAVLEASGDGVVTCAPDGTVLSWNAGAQAILGYSAAEILGRDIALLAPPDRRHETEHHRWLLERGLPVPPFDTVRIAKNGSPVPVELRLAGLRDGTGALARIAYVLRDASTRKRAEAELARKAALARLMEALARAANEAARPEEALQQCLERICDYGRWTLGAVALLPPAASRGIPQAVFWRCADPLRFAKFIWRSENTAHTPERGVFVGRALREKKPVWIADTAAVPAAERVAEASRAGLRSAFCFPILAGGAPVASIEFVADEPREPDPALVEASSAISSQLARLIERQRALDQARAAERKLSGILDALGEVVWSMDVRTGRLLYLNDAAKRLARRPVTDFLADRRLWRRMVHREDRGAVRRAIRELLARGAHAHEFRLVLADGEIRTVENRARVVHDAAGRPERVDGTLSDITERRRAEVVRDQLAAMVENASDAVVCRTLDGTVTYWNAAAERLFGWKAAEVIGRDLSFLVPPERETEAAHRRWRLASGEILPPHETTRLARDGRRIDVSVSASPVRDAQGRIAAVSLAYRDVGERRRREREAERRAALAQLLEALARAANEADRPEEALQQCLERICEYGRWRIGHVMHLARSSDTWSVAHAQWHFAQPGPFEEFVRASDAAVFGGHAGGFVTPALLERRPFWAPRLDALAPFPRIAQARALGLGSGFVFPVTVAGGEIAACLEFFAEGPREPDQPLLEALPGVASQLARLIERSESEGRRAMEHAVTRVLAEAVSLDEAMPRLIRTMCEAMRWDYGARWAWSEAERNLCRAEFWSSFEPDFDPADRHYWLRLGPGGPGGLLRRAWQAKETTWLADLDQDETFRRRASCAKLGLRSGYAFPILAGAEVVGVMEFFGRVPRQPDRMLLGITEAIGRQIGEFIRRRQAEERLRASEEHFRAMFENAAVGITRVDLEGRLLDVNRRFCEMLGYEAAELLGRPARSITHPDDYGQGEQFRAQLASGRESSAAGEKRFLRKDGAIVWARRTMSVVRDAAGAPRYIVSVVEDITERKLAEERANYLAHYDPVTGLPNRGLFTDRLAQAIARDRRAGRLTALLLLDLDRFKQVNETLGHGAGDEALRAITARLRERLRGVDTIARLGGDEFAVIVEGVTQSAQPLRVADRIMEALAEPLALADQEVFLTASIGVAISVYASEADAAEKLVEHAELAMYRAKQEGRNSIQLYAPDPAAPRRGGLGMESRLRRALERGELLLHYQPRVEIATGAVTGAEALVRWQNPELGRIAPADFIPLAEETGLIVPIGEWVLASACAQAGTWARAGHPLRIAVNLSARQFRQANLAELVTAALADSALEPRWLELEITESMIMHRPEQAAATLARLHEIGVELSVDDFGTGYSSLSYLKRFPVDSLKIDQSFVRELAASADDAAIVRAVIALARSLGLKTVAEGVETAEQLAYLAGLGCDEYQGYFFSRPLAAADFFELLRSPRRENAPPAGGAARTQAGRVARGKKAR